MFRQIAKLIGANVGRYGITSKYSTVPSSYFNKLQYHGKIDRNFALKRPNIQSMTNIRMVKLQIVSDIHLEHIKHVVVEKIIVPSAPVLIMAGDISTYDCKSLPKFIEWISANFEAIIWVFGNHEYYNTKQIPMASIKEIFQKMTAEYPNIHILDNETCYIDTHNILIIGSTLWSHIPQSNVKQVAKYMNDYRYIKESDSMFSPDASSALFEQNVDFIQKTINENLDKKIVVVTHHAPVTENTSDKMYEGSTTNCAFSSDVFLDNIDQVKLWCYGHTHHNSDFVTKYNYKLVANQYGYNGQTSGNTYKNNFVVDL